MDMHAAIGHTDLVGLVLAGGKSTRLGTDKTELDVNGRPLLARTVSMLNKFCSTVLVSGRDPQPLGVNAQWLPDDEPGMGPIGGIITALRRLQSPLVVLACDLPFMDEDTLNRLLGARAERPESAVMTTFLQMDTGFIEALVSVYEPAALDHLQRAREEGILKLSRAVAPEFRHHEPYTRDEAMVFFNLNYPADLAMLQRIKPVSARKTG